MDQCDKSVAEVNEHHLQSLQIGSSNLLAGTGRQNISAERI